MSGPPDDERRGADAHLIETRIASEDVFDGKLLHVKRDTVRLPDGETATREYIAHPGAVMIVPRLPDGKLLMERQFRYPLARVFIEFPAGKIDPGEEPSATAARELLEETGYTAERWAHIGTLHPLITYSTERIEIYIADGLSFVGAKLRRGRVRRDLHHDPRRSACLDRSRRDHRRQDHARPAAARAARRRLPSGERAKRH